MTTKAALNVALKVVGAHGFDGVHVRASNYEQALSRLLTRTTVPSGSIATVLREFRRQKLVDFAKNTQNITLTLTPAGASRLQQLSIDELRIKKPARWDNRWRFVTFDIPVNQSKERVKLTRQLQKLGFQLLQRSLWVHPYPCFTEVEKVAGHFNLMRYCTVFEAGKFDTQTQSALNKMYATFEQRGS